MADGLFPDLPPPPPRPTGILADRQLRELAAAGRIAADPPIGEDQIQPASIDLRLGPVAWRVRASFLPGRGHRVADKLEQFEMHRIDLTGGAVLERGCVYIVRLLESLDLPPGVSGAANPKSSTGRLDVFTRLIADHTTEFETVGERYRGPLYAEISPRTFSVLVRRGSRLNQLRLRRGQPLPFDRVRRVPRDAEAPIDAGGTGSDTRKWEPIGVDLEGDPETGLVGYRAKPHTALIDIDRVGACDALDYWEPVRRRAGRPAELILNPGEFYILMSKEPVRVDRDHAAEMRPYDTRVGEFRVHYAGFFDPGFGMEATGGAGARAVLEVRSHDVPFLIEHGQTVCQLVYERMMDIPDKLYGAGLGSSYQGQGLKLSKHFRAPEAVGGRGAAASPA